MSRSMRRSTKPIPEPRTPRCRCPPRITIGPIPAIPAPSVPISISRSEASSIPQPWSLSSSSRYFLGSSRPPDRSSPSSDASREVADLLSGSDLQLCTDPRPSPGSEVSTWMARYSRAVQRVSKPGVSQYRTRCGHRIPIPAGSTGTPAFQDDGHTSGLSSFPRQFCS